MWGSRFIGRRLSEVRKYPSIHPSVNIVAKSFRVGHYTHTLW